MSGLFEHTDQVLPAWKDFVAGRQQCHPVRPAVKASWVRSSQNGVNPFRTGKHRMKAIASDVKASARDAELLQIARPIMENLYQFVKGSGFVVALAADDGFIIDLVGDAATLENPLTRNFFCGASWREEDVGTNAIGTALTLRTPIQVSGAEHFCQQHHGLTCSAAPIFVGDKTIGVLDMSGAACASHLHTLGMVVAAAEAVTAQLAIQRKSQDMQLTNQRLVNIFNSMSDGVLMIDAYGVIEQMNAAARRILNRSDEEVVGVHIERVFGSKAVVTRRLLQKKESYEDVEIMLDTKNSTLHCVASGEPLLNVAGQLVGAVIILRPIRQIQNLITRFSGYHASLRFEDIIGTSPEIQEAVRVASLAAAASSHVLLQGESGTGKEIFAQAIHNRSSRRGGPFVALNCGVIPRELIGSELFGYVEGAFSGARRGGKPGKFEMALGGTLFLDEIGDMPLEQQVALLRVLQEKRLSRIGGNEEIPVDVRIICATNKNLLQEVERKTFRQDLYYRLNVISLTLPPLRKRPTDIPLLIRHFLERFGRDRGAAFTVDAEVIRCLQEAEWPGNIRELQNVVERAVSLTTTQAIDLSHISSEYIAPVRRQPEVREGERWNEPHLYESRAHRRQMVQKTERQMILGLLTKCGGNVSMVAREMGLSRNTLYRKMQQYDIHN